MANLPNNGSKSEQKMSKQGAAFLENAVSKIQERRCDLSHRQQYLKEKISAMERSIPALMAFNMWTSGTKCDDPPLCKIRQIMSKLSPNYDPTDRLVDGLRNTVESLNMETAELHDKIINADIRLEESRMELESIEMENKEIEESLKSLEKELNKKKTPSLHSIHSEDLFCLAKIRQLGEEEINLKNSIRELEERETIFQEQINRILTSREFQKSVCNDDTCERRINPCHMKPRIKDSQDMKKKLMSRGKHPTKLPEEKTVPKQPEAASVGASGAKNVEILEPGTKASATSRGENAGKEKTPKSRAYPVSGTTGCYEKISCSSASKTSTSGRVRSNNRKSSPSRNQRNVISRQQHSLSLSGNSGSKHCSSIFPAKQGGKACSSCCKYLSSSIKSFGKSSNRSTTAIKPRCCGGKTCCQTLPNAKFSGGTICKKCLARIATKERRESFLASCRGKCALTESVAACNCTEDYEAVAVDEEFESRRDRTRSGDRSSTDEEYSECCDCGCNDSDFSASESF